MEQTGTATEAGEGTAAARPSAVWPTLRYTDAKAAIAFLCETFGFRQTIEVPEGDLVAHAELVWPDGGAVMIASAAVDEGAPDPLPAGVGAVYLVTSEDRVRTLWERVRQLDVRVMFELHEASYGSTTFTIRDHEGVYWTIGTYAGA
ncbi:VOC family protein [Qaidamihabitans albus]|uniref:VOC family protein n=1 Tax=Qaidamihabitans albus TaxID=2795733 RepID=UPI0018F1DB1E|nr:VOC family protein [Qaidamihabitans albus]